MENSKQNKSQTTLKLPGVLPFFLIVAIVYFNDTRSSFQAKHAQVKLPELTIDSAHWESSIPCLSCHVLHSSPGAQLTSVAGNANLCMSCHNPVGMASSTPFANADKAEPGVGGTSHAWDKPAVNTLYGANHPTNPFIAEKIMDGEVVCSTCHEPHYQNYPPFLRTSNGQDALCKDCHAIRDVGLYSTDPAANVGSHPVGVVYDGADSRLETSPTDPNILLIDSRVECSSCHQVHYANTNDGYLLRATNDDNLCQSCHTYRPHQGTGCTDCHQPHNPNRANIYMIRDTVPTPNSGLQPVLFTAQTGANSFADGDAVYDGICEACHTTTNYHRNNAGGDHTHNMGLNCTSCHSHQQAFAPESCIDCHNQPQDNGDNIPPGGRRQIVGAGGDFLKTSHHVVGAVDNSDCVACHYMSDHQSGTVKLLDPDLGPALVYDYDPANPEGIEGFCINCHDDNGAVAGNGLTPFSDGQTVPDIKMGSVWDNSAHNTIGYAQNSGNPVSCFGNGLTTGCHGNGHGSDNLALLSAPASQSLSDFCFNCHTDGLITNNALAGSANDIEESFSLSRKHNLGVAFTESGNNFTLECTSCHNPHIVTGKHWDVASGVSPVTRPDFSDPVGNPRAMGTTLWGDGAGEKMQDFAARASGTGGFYRKTAEGYTLGATGLPADQAAQYRPPKTATGLEFSGDVLPDYTTLCLDCHSYQMSSSVGPVNWGQGIPTGYPEPPGPGYVNWVATSSPHGLNAANTSSYISDAGTAGFWGSSGNPDVLFDMNYVTRGRHNGYFMRWPYETADRGAGINFVLSCTDCHEAHGSAVSSMLRSTVNNGPGTPVWNTMCNNCHYYYGGPQHSGGVSCGTASCHEANSIHRIKKNGGGGPTQLMLTAAGYESNYIPPDFTPEIISVTGSVGSNELVVTFRASQYGTGPAGIFANPDLTGALQPDDFWLLDKGNDNPRTITGVTHTAGDLTAIITMSAPLIAADLGVDILATTGNSVWGWYDGGYNNWATGIVPAQEVAAGPWPVVITP